MRVEIKVVAPCGEKWNTFEKRGLNGYCNSCEKIVVDFTKMSDNEIKTYFKKSTNNVCGRMRTNQQKVYSDTSRISLKPLTSILMVSGAFLFSGISANAQSKDETEQTSWKGKYHSKENIRPKNSDRIITGTVTDDNAEQLLGVNIFIKGTTISSHTDLEGNYSIAIDEGSTLIYSFVGFQTQEVEVGTRTTIDISMGGVTELGEIIVGGVQYRWFTPRGIWSGLKNLVRRML
jgi:hypothetical protein